MGMGIVNDEDFDRQAELLRKGINPSPANSVSRTIPSDNSVKKAPFTEPKTDTENNHEVIIPEVVKNEVIDSRELLRRSKTRGRNPGDNNVPLSLQKLIGETGSLDSRQEAIQLANDFGVSASSASAYANGATSTTTYNQPTEIASHITKVKQRLAKKARGKLNLALENLTPEKLQNAKAKDISGVARDMAGVIRALENDPSNSINLNGESGKPQITIYAPSIVQENYFGEPLELNE